MTIWHRGQAIETTATLDDDPAQVAAALQRLAAAGGSLRSVGVRMVPERQVSAADVAAVDRAVIRFDMTGLKPREPGGHRPRSGGAA